MNRSVLLYLLVVFIGVVFLSRLFYLQVMNNEYNIPTLSNSAVKVTYDYPERGFIYDRNNVLLVANQLSYDIMIIPREVKPLDTLEFCKLLKISKDEFLTKFEKARNYSTWIPST